MPETVGQIARCIYESLALKYCWALERLEEIKGQRIDTLNIVGGGCQNELLNQFAADSIDRAVVRRSEAVHTYEPHHTPEWEAAYQKMRTFSRTFL